MSNMSEQKEQFRGLGRCPEEWLESMEGLEKAAKLLKQKIDDDYNRISDEGYILIKPYFLLAGYALETCLKGILTAQKKIEFKDGYLLPFTGDKRTEHDLIKLAGLAGISLLPYEEILFKRLINHVLWEGRYPIPRACDELPVIEGMVKTGYSRREIILIDKTIAEFRSLLIAEIDSYIDDDDI